MIAHSRSETIEIRGLTHEAEVYIDKDSKRPSIGETLTLMFPDNGFGALRQDWTLIRIKEWNLETGKGVLEYT